VTTTTLPSSRFLTITAAMQQPCHLSRWGDEPRRADSPSAVEPTEPLADERETALVERVNARTTALLLVEQAGVLEDAEVARGRGPLVLEARGDLTCSRDATTKMERQQDLPAGGVRQSKDDLLERFELFLRVQAGSTSQMVSSSSTGPMGSQTAMTSGV